MVIITIPAAPLVPANVQEIEDVGLNPTRTALLDVLRRFGARVDVHPADGSADSGEPNGTVTVEYDRAHPIDIRPDEIPSLIDELPAIAALAAHGGHVTVSGAGELRVKESDRIATLVAGFRALGLDADERPDGFVVAGAASASGHHPKGVANAHGDHRAQGSRRANSLILARLRDFGIGRHGFARVH